MDRAWRAANASLELEMQRQCNSATAPTLKLTVAQRLKKRAELIQDALASSIFMYIYLSSVPDAEIEDRLWEFTAGCLASLTYS